MVPAVLVCAALTYVVDGTFEPQTFAEPYQTVDGVLTFRGHPRRDGGAWGTATVVERKLKVAWKAQTGEGEPPWGGGAGWTGQPVIVRWPKENVAAMKVRVPKGSDDFVEVIQGSLDGHVYFLDLRTGRPTRTPIDTGNMIKGSVAVDPRGLPLLFVGQGNPRKPYVKPLALRVYSLVTNRELWSLKGRDEHAPITWWGAFDSSAIVNRATDTLVVGGENGLLYEVKLHSAFAGGALTIAPEVARYASTYPKAKRAGIEGSVSVADSTAFFAKDGGIVQAVDLKTLTPLWSFVAGDDTDATITVSNEESGTYVYTGNELDRRGLEKKGNTTLRKLDAKTGEQRWERTFPCEGVLEPKRKEAGLFSTNVVGKGDVADLVVFMLSRCPTATVGTLVALKKSTGETAWETRMKAPGWSSTTAITDQDGKTWLLQGDMHGKLHLIDAKTGAKISYVQLEGNVEASPAVFDSRIVVATRSRNIYAIDVK